MSTGTEILICGLPLVSCALGTLPSELCLPAREKCICKIRLRNVSATFLLSYHNICLWRIAKSNGVAPGLKNIVCFFFFFWGGLAYIYI